MEGGADKIVTFDIEAGLYTGYGQPDDGTADTD